MRDSLPKPPCIMSMDQRPYFWRVVQGLVRAKAVEPRDMNPDLYPLRHYKAAVKLGWAEQVPGSRYLTFRITKAGEAEFKQAFQAEKRRPDE